LARIYALIDPPTGAVRYIGQTVRSLRDRLREHREDAVLDPTQGAKQQWLYGLHRAGIAPRIVELARVPYLERDRAEQWWIAEYRRRGTDLLNLSPGGGRVDSWDLFVARQQTTGPKIRVQPPEPTLVACAMGRVSVPEWAVGADYTLVVVSRLRARLGARSSHLGAESRVRLLTKNGQDYRACTSWGGLLAREEAAYRAIACAVDDLRARIQAHKQPAGRYSLRLIHHYEQILHQIEGGHAPEASALRPLCKRIRAASAPFRSIECMWMGYRDADALIGPIPV